MHDDRGRKKTNTGFGNLRLRQVQRLIADRHGIELRPDQEGRRFVRFALEHLANMGGEDGPRQKMVEWCKAVAPWLSAAKMEPEIEAAIERAIYHPEWWTARRAGNWLRVTTEERDRLRLDTFRAIDRTDKQYDADSRAKGAERQRRYRENKKLKDQNAEQREAAKPWSVAGVSRASWYRKRAKSSGSVGLTSSPQPEQMATSLTRQRNADA